MVGGEHQQQRIATMLFRDMQRRHGDGGRRIAAHRFEHEDAGVTLAKPCPGQLVLAHEKVVAIGDGQNLTALRHIGGPQIGLEQQALAVGQLHEWFGMTFAGDRPETGSGAAGENDWNQHGDNVRYRRKEAILQQKQPTYPH